jgi:hypothetical protein
MILLRPVPANSIVTQTFDQHRARAMKGGYCEKPQAPGQCPNGYYYPGWDWVTMPAIGHDVLASAIGKAEVRDEGAKGYGLNVKFTHPDGYVTVYAHLSDALVETGETVRTGDVIGLTGWSGNVWDYLGNRSPAAAHLHYELRKGGIPIDPMPYLTGSIVPPPPEPPVVTPPAGFVYPVGISSLPEFVTYRPTSLITKYIRVRVNYPDGMMIDQLNPGETFHVFGWSEEKNGNVWFWGWTVRDRFGYAAAFYNGEVWMEPVA